jgi:hypothetical protein
MIGGLHPAVQGRAHTREQLVELDGRVLVRLRLVSSQWRGSSMTCPAAISTLRVSARRLRRR